MNGSWIRHEQRQSIENSREAGEQVGDVDG
jgi:hypothetical protein